MSAIFGICNLDEEPVNIDHGKNLMRALQKYPADDVQTWHKGNIFLGCHAQWITPESVGERLPYYDHERQLAITADAIIDNRDELFERLYIDQAHRKKMPDSELILLAYHKWGEEVPKYLIGDFAFMIWDGRKHMHFGARDFSGSRTLYYYRTQKRFAFCTAILPLFTLPCIEKKFNEQWLSEFLAIPHMFNSLDAGSTVYKNIEQVPPSHSITVIGGNINITRFCTLTNGEKLKLKSNEEYVEAFREVFQSAINSRLRTHRLVGAYLSGGLDSGSVVSFAAKALNKENKKLYTYSFVPPDDFVDWTPKYLMANERPFIQSTVKYVGNIVDHYLNFAGKSPLTEINDWLDVLEMPYKFFENSFWLKGICEQAHEHGVGVLLSGAKGNFTTSWGLAYDYFALLLKKLKWIRLYNEVSLYRENVGVGWRQAIPYIGKTAFPFLNRTFRSTEPYQFPVHINPELAKRTGVFDKLKEYGINLSDEIVNMFEARKRHFKDVLYYNSPSVAKLSLRYSLWNRDPTNDLRVVRFCLSVPEEQCVQNGLDRALIRRSTKNFLPDKVRLNQRIQGEQGVDWVHRMTSSWHAYVEELQQMCLDPVVSEYFDLKVVKAAISKLQAGPRPEYALDPQYRITMRCLIFYRFIKNN